jgi:sulfide:quinone oxidoreductase
LGDVANTPTSKTIAAITQQAPTVVKNIIHMMKKEPLSAKYNGYTSCPIVTNYGSKSIYISQITHSLTEVLLAEFLYDGVVQETFPFNQAKPSRTMYFLKDTVFPKVYWSMFLRGYWYGPSTLLHPKLTIPPTPGQKQ